MESSKKYDVLIVGCGPSGAILANLLNAKGHKVAIFDRDVDIFHAPRAMMMDMESCRIVNRMGLYQRLMKEDAVPFHCHRFVSAKHKLLMEVNISGVGVEHDYEPVMFHQPAFEAMLREDFKKGPGVEAFLGYEVLSIDGEGAEATLIARNLETGEEVSFSGQYLVGADGGASTCRKYINANRVDLNYSRDWIVMDLIIHDREWWNNFREGSAFTCEPNAAVVVVKGVHGHIRMDFEQPSAEAALAFTEEDAHRLIAEYIDVDSKHIEIIRRQPYKFYAGMPDQWRKGRVFLAGDAAHQTSPFAGQGLNMGIRDAANLSIKLDMVLKGMVSDAFLDTYQEERWENCAHMINGATKRGLMLSTSSKREILARNLSFLIGRVSSKLAYFMTENMSNMAPYKDGLIGKSHPLSGARFFPPTLRNSHGDKLVIDELIGDRFAIISRGPVQGQGVEWLQTELGGICLTIGSDIEDSRGVLTKYFQSHNADVILLRPDFYVFDAGQGANEICLSLRSQLSKYGFGSRG
ncbi:hypothetical protein HCU74_00815 [Spongiibacter sp. KMU-166]|uniref:FAD-binding domain-containing protein n=1 Tax=Spongiibacter thalassae TaxID=2721624 RepID=A0ABX1G9W5_9GAMM|nr:FAD-dependent monooxygenase [Spongiibacter thalassae]NKI15947.1 hypothetical protein [Spongiibacter thalassae]